MMRVHAESGFHASLGMSFPAELDAPWPLPSSCSITLIARCSKQHVARHISFHHLVFCPGPVMTVSEVVFLYIKQATEDAACDYLQVCLRSHSWCTRSTVQFE